ncbi:PREDICTED: chaoptin [Ceratosolen solmsi marchali]|uniref:Chaoptin n=1 Tax=Ceratosolen solmsi marchali TaxID=326594 RepID=A0AAJ6YMC4_9HYME|nr:PREDICTED: chaoptin [Ceratosolen solmsi marchali]
MAYFFLLIFLLLSTATAAQSNWRPCIEVKRTLRIPCQCTEAISNLNNTTLSLEVNCDNIILADDALSSLSGQPIVSFSQQFCGHQNLPNELISILPENIEKLNLCNNEISRLMDRQLQRFINLNELRLANNALGDNLNPIFSSNEFHDISSLKILDLQSNGLRHLEEGIFKRCINLEELYLDYNNLTSPPIDSLKGPKAIKVLSLAGNNIGTIRRGTFSILGRTLLHLDLSSNELLHFEDGALIEMVNLLTLNISHNNLQRLNSDVFKDAIKLQQLDISSNFLKYFPLDALHYSKGITFLNISNNLITELDDAHLSNLKNLEFLDLSRNNIGRLSTNAFITSTSLIQLDLSFNALRAIEEASFGGLTNLQYLSLRDNNILLMPSASLARLPSLMHLNLEFNRIAVITSEILRTSVPHLTSFSLKHNLMRELPPRLFYHFNKLDSLELSGNMISEIDRQSFVGIEDTLTYLDLSANQISIIDELPLKNLVSLNLADNLLKKISPGIFKHFNQLQYLNISNNPLYGGFPPIFPKSLISLDASFTDLQILPSVLLLNLENLESISFLGNKLQEIGENTFKNLYNLTSIDLSYNKIANIESEAFVGLQNLYKLNLQGNNLRIFGGEHFNTGTGLEILNLSNNVIEYLSPTVFIIHPRLREIDLSWNRFTIFPNELMKTLQFLEILNLSNNLLHTIKEFGFAQIIRLRDLNLSNNRIESVEELAFHNSTQLQRLDLSNNRLEYLSERMMEGILRMEKLDLTNNRLSSLPEKIFDVSRIRSLEGINLSGNFFVEIPTRALQKQVANLRCLNIARNRLSEIFTQDIISSVKCLDISENSLSENTVYRILSEAKVLRYLNIASCGVHKITKLEAPFLQYLNLSNNALKHIESFALERTTMLEDLDISKNQLQSFESLLNTFGSISPLKILDISENDIKIVNESSLIGFENLKKLKMFDLINCTRIEKSAFKSLFKLRNLQAFNFPRLGYFDVQGIIKEMNNLEALDIEIKDLNVGNEQLFISIHPRLKSLILRGERLRNVLSSLLVGIKSPDLSIQFKNTSIETIPATLLFPVPRSTLIELDVSGSKLKIISSQLISTFEERSKFIQIKGLKLKIKCDCEAKHLWRWYKNMELQRENSITCITPESLKGYSLLNLTEKRLSCIPEQSTTLLQLENTETITTTKRPTSSKPEVIWTIAPTTQDSRNTKYSVGDSPMNVSSGITNNTDDTLIISIVGGIVAFIAIVMIIICICRLRWSNQMNQSRMQAAMSSSIHEASMLRPSSAYSGKLNQDLYVSSYNGSTLGHNNNSSIVPATQIPATPVHMLPFIQSLPMIHTSNCAQPIYGYYDSSPLPFYVAESSENKFDR